MLEMFMFVISLAVAQALAGLIVFYALMKLFLSKKFIVNYYRTILKLLQDITEELEKEDLV